MWSLGSGPAPAIVGAALALGCSAGSSGAGGGGTSSGGTAATGDTTSGGSEAGNASSLGGATSSGGAMATGGGFAAGGSAAPAGGAAGSGGAQAAGGTPSAGGATSTGGVQATGGIPSTGGAPGTGGIQASGGIPSTSGAPGTGGVQSTGGIPSTGGDPGTGGVQATGGIPSTGGAPGTGGVVDDQCDLGVYDSANPPRVLSLSGNLGTHDPSALESGGTFYLFATGLDSKTSTDLTSWQGTGRPFGTPSWASSSVPGVSDLWAPDISYFGGVYHLYYAASTFGNNRSCIGQATRSALDSGSWADQGAVICSNVDSSDNWNAIDPNAVLDDQGTPWLVFGSFWTGIQVIELDQTGARVGTTVTQIAARPGNGGALEGPAMVRRCSYYYLFTSWDTCCQGANSTYNIRVVRSTSVTGPFEDQDGTAALQGGGTLIAEGDGTWAGPGGQSVLISGNDAYLVYHAYARSNGASTLRIAELVWDPSGWPVPVGP